MHKATPIRLLAFSLLVVFALLFSSLTARAATTGGVEGTITSIETGRPLPSVKVTLLAPDGSVANRTNTDTKGQYSFVGVTPGAYTISTSIVTFTPVTSSVTITQDQTVTLNFSLQKSIKTGKTTVRVQGIPPGRVTQTATEQVVTARDEQHLKSQAYDLYQYPGITAGQPGFTEDPATGLPSIRGADINQTGYQLDGVDITDGRSNYFGTNLVTNGLKSANVYTAGADASYGGHTGGFVNVITNNGRDLRGGIVEYTGPGSSNWSYAGTNTQYGNVIAGTKLDYYVSSVVFKNGFPNDVFGLKKVNSYDGLFKVNYYGGPSDTVSLEHGNGYEGYTLPNDLTTTSFSEGNSTFNTIGQKDGKENQSYMLDILNYQHNFTPKSYGNFRYYHLRNGFEENDPGDYVTQDNTKQGLSFDYNNQLAKTDQLKLGYVWSPQYLTYRLVYDPAVATIDRNLLVHTYNNALYAQNQIRLAKNKLTLDTGVRYNQQQYNLVSRVTATGTVNPSYTATSIDPRIGATYAVTPSFLIRSNFGLTSQFPDAGRVQNYVAPEEVGIKPVAGDNFTANYTQLRYGLGNKLKAEHSQNTDIGIEQGFAKTGGFLDGSYDVVLNTYRRHQWNQLLLERISRATGLEKYIPTTAGTRSIWTNDGKADSSGVEFLLTKRVRRPSDWNGFVSYTNQVEKNSAVLNNGYASFFYTAFINSPNIAFTNDEFIAANRQEREANYAQRHTVYVSATKRFSKLFETSINLDAGSGYPFANGIANNTGAYGIDSQHAPEGALLAPGGSTASFNEVPILLPGGTNLQPLTPITGHTSWHYKFSLNSNVYVTKSTNLFFNVDNVFDRLTTLVFAPYDARFVDFYQAPTAAYPQGRVVYGPNISQTPVQVTFGFRTKF